MNLSWLTNRNAVLVEAAKAKRKFHPALTFLIAIGLFFVAHLLVGLAEEAYVSFADWIGFPRHWFYMFIRLIPIVIVVLYVKFVEKRSMESLGFVSKGALVNYLKGALFAVLFVGLFAFACISFGLWSYEGYVAGSLQLALLIPLGFDFILGLAEEVEMRGFMMVSLSNRMSVFWAVFISSVIFGVAHIFDGDPSFMNIVNIVLIGFLFSFYFLRTNSIWGVAAFHAIYNFMLENIISIPIAGIENTPVLSINYNGGLGVGEEFIMTAVTLSAIALVLFVPKKQAKTTLT